MEKGRKLRELQKVVDPKTKEISMNGLNRHKHVKVSLEECEETKVRWGGKCVSSDQLGKSHVSQFMPSVTSFQSRLGVVKSCSLPFLFLVSTISSPISQKTRQ